MNPDADGNSQELSARELEILRLVVTGVTNREIALRLFISPNTVKVHLRNIFAKLGVESRTEAALVAIQRGWFAVPREPPEQPIDARPAPGLSWGRRGFLLGGLAAALGMALWPRNSETAGRSSSAMTDDVLLGSGSASAEPLRRWSQRAAMPVPRQRFAAVACGHVIAVIGGDTAAGVSGDVLLYDSVNDSWSAGAAKPVPVSNVAGALVGEEILVPGGYGADGRVRQDVEVYDLRRDVWRRAAPMPEGRCAYALSVVQDRLFLLGGWSGQRYVSDVWTYDVQRDRWDEGTPMPSARGFAGAASVDGRVYVVGGLDGARELGDCLILDVNGRHSGEMDWRAGAPLRQARAGHGLARAGRWIYAVGGGWNGGLTCNEVYDTMRDRWEVFPTPIVGQWRTLGVASIESPLGTEVFAIGGWAGERLALNQAYRAVLSVYLPGLP
ncbi:MAG: Kelch repeat-containing protein [Anaerolineae bacterium]